VTASANGQVHWNGRIEGLLSWLPSTGKHIEWGRIKGAPSWVTVSGDLTPGLAQAHLDGRKVVGAFPYADGVARFGVLDVDLHLKDREPTADEVEAVERYAVAKARQLERAGIACLLVRGHRVGSYHIFLRVAPMLAARLGRWLKTMVADAGDIHVDTYPEPDGEGNAARLPGRHHRRPDAWSEAWNGTGWEPWPAAFDRLLALPENPTRLFPDPGGRSADQKSKSKTDPPRGERPGDVFNLLVPVEDVLKACGWTVEREDGDRVRFTRPGKDGGVSASVKDATVWVFTSSVKGLPVSSESGKPYTAFGLIAHLEYEGDFKVAARELAKAGFCRPSQEPRATFGGKGTSGNPGQTPPQQSAAVIPPYVPFPTHLLPPVVSKYVGATAAAMNCDPSYSALPALAALGAAIGSSHVANPKKGWKEPPYVWALPIGKSGTTKSPPYRDVEDVAEDINDRLEAEYEIEVVAYEARMEEWAEKKRAAKETGEDPGPKPKPPVEKSFIKGDVTIEALIGTLQDNPRGQLIGQDELSAWIGGFVKYAGKTGTSDLPRWLQLSNAGAINYTRKTGDRRKVRIRGVGVSVAGTIQPLVLSRVLTEEFRAAGFLARLLLAMPPWRKRQWTEAEVDDADRGAFAELLDDLHRLPPGAWPDGRPAPHLVRLSDEAKTLFVAFYNANGAALETADEDMAAVMSKLEGYALRFALIFHCCRLKGDAAQTPITAEDVAAAIKLTTWFRDETERVYLALGETPEQQAARSLFEVIQRLAERRGGRVTARNLQRSNSRKYPTAAAAEAVLESLVGHGFGYWAEIPPGPKGGAPTRAFVPRVAPDTTDTTSPGDDNDPPDDEGGDEGAPDTTPEDRPPPGAGPAPEPGVTDEDGSPSGEGGEADPEVASDVSGVGQAAGRFESPPGTAADGVAGCVRPNGVVSGNSRSEGYALITSPADVVAIVGAIEDDGGPVGIDTETTGLDPLADRVRLLQVATGRSTFVIDLFALADPPAALAELFAVLAQVEVLGHNLQFDLRFLARLGFTPGRVFDTQLASQVLHAGERADNNALLRHALKDVAARELGRGVDKSEQTSDWSRPVLTPEQIAYAAADAAVLLPLAEALKQKLAEAGLTATAEVEMRALPGVAWAAPVRVDAATWTAIADTAAAEQVCLAGEMDALAPNGTSLFASRNWNSPDQVRAAFAGLGVTLDSTDDDALAALDHPLAALLRDYRAAAKRAGTYGRKWLAKHAGPDGRVLPSWNQLGAESSGRMSCSDPNLQNVPRGPDYRRCFVAGPGNVLLKADYSQIELRIAAKLTGERRMLDAYRSGQDLHALTAAALLGKPAAEVAKPDRQLAKAVNFGLLYGQSAKGLRAYALANYGVSLSLDEAVRHRETFFRTYPGLRRWHRSVGDGPTDTRTLGGRRRVGVTRFTEKLNTPVQGTGADGLKAAIALLWERRAECPGAVPVLFVHDEIVLEVPEADADAASAWLRRCMVDAVAPLLDPVPVEVEVSVGKTWGG
jgi:DNA polymerase I-like protein with 3'-5' exonuclease and polymerase domains